MYPFVERQGYELTAQVAIELFLWKVAGPLVLLKFLKLFCAVKHNVIIIEYEIICGCDIVTFCRN